MGKLTRTYREVLAVVIAVAAWLCPVVANARAFNNKDFERYYNLTPKEFQNCIEDYIVRNIMDSALMCANIQASKYGKIDLSMEEINACCCAFRYMAMMYMNESYNYELAAKNFLKAQGIAEKHHFVEQQAINSENFVILSAIKNDILTNFAYSQNVMDDFKKSFELTIRLYNRPQKQLLDTEISTISNRIANIIYIAIKYDKTQDITGEIEKYLNLLKNHKNTSRYTMENLCEIVQLMNNDEYNKALTLFNANAPTTPYRSQKDSLTACYMNKVTLYKLLMKCKRIKEAETLLAQIEHENRANSLTYGLLEILNMLQHHYEHQGNESLARKYEFEYYKTKDEFIKKSLIGKVDQVKLDLQLEDANEKMHEMEYQQKVHKMLLWGLSAFALMALIILAIVFANNRKIRKKNEILYKRTIELLQTQPVEQPEPEAVRPLRDEPSQNALLERICKVMETSPEVYGESFTINRLAELVDSNRNYVSQVINDRKKCNFNAMLNDYRIKEACRRLLDTEHYGGYTIEGIARSVGFKSRTNFAAVFKDITGLTPSAFQKMSGGQ